MNQLAPMGSQAMANPFSFDTYQIKRPWPTFLGRNFEVYDPSMNLRMFVQHKLLTFKDEWNIFTDKGMAASLVRVKAREAIAMNVTTDVMDAMSGQIVGTVRSKGMKSIVRDTWEVLDPAGNVVGELIEDSNGLLRRMLPSFFGMPIMPGKWHLAINGQVAMEVTEQRVFFGKTFHVKINRGVADARFSIGCALLALMREIMRESR
jgi:uncharacterized protein YxjI